MQQHFSELFKQDDCKINTFSDCISIELAWLKGQKGRNVTANSYKAS